MVEVTFINPLAQVPSVQTSGGQQGASSASLPSGTLLAGVIAGKDNSGNYLLRTDSGTLTLHSTVPLTYNSDVVVQIASSGNNARLISVNGESFAAYAAPEEEATDSLSPSLLANLPQEIQAAPTTQVSTPPTTQAPTTVNLEAVVVASTPTTEPVALVTPGATSLPTPGTNVTLQIVLPSNTGSLPTNVATTTTFSDVVSSAPQNIASQALVQSPTVSTASNSAVTAAPISPVEDAPVVAISSVSPSPPASVATNVSPQATALIAPSSPPVAEAPNTPNAPNTNTAATTSSQYAAYANAKPPAPAEVETPEPVITANANPPAAETPPSAPQTTILSSGILAASPSSSPAPTSTLVLSTPLGMVTVETANAAVLDALSPDSAITISIPANTGSLAPQAASLPALAVQWDTLGDIITALGTTSPDTASALVSRLPEVGQPNFIASSLSLAAAVSSGNINAFLGEEAVSQLRVQGRNDLLQRMSTELGTFKDFAGAANAPATAANTPTNSSWQPLFMPFMYDKEIQQVRLYMKRDGNKGKNGKSAADTRFVVEVDLSELGPVQFDGLLQKEVSPTSFDLIIRSTAPFSAQNRQDITQIYATTSQITGFRGNLSFQVMQDFPVKPLEELLPTPSGIMV